MIEYDSAARPPRALEELHELRAHASLLRALVARNIKVHYKRSAFGFLWTMASPALMLACEGTDGFLSTFPPADVSAWEIQNGDRM